MIWKKVKRMSLKERGELIELLVDGSELKKTLGDEYVVTGENLLVRRCSNCKNIDLLRGDVYAYGGICYNCNKFGEVELDKPQKSGTISAP